MTFDLSREVMEQRIRELRVSLEPLQKEFDVANTVAKSTREEELGSRREYDHDIDEFEREFNRLKAEAYEKLHNSLLEIRERQNKAIDERYAAQLKKQELEAALKLLQEQLNKLIQDESEKKAWSDLWDEFKFFFEDGPWAELEEYQRQDVMVTVKAFRDGWPGLLNMNDMGLGKTVEATVSLEIIKQEFKKLYDRDPRIIWLTEKSLIDSAFDEVHKWVPDFRCLQMPGSLSADFRDFVTKSAIDHGAMLITNYRAISTTPAVLDFDWDIVVIDEVQALKGGAQSKPPKFFTDTQKLVEHARFQLFLSGTPAENRMLEVYPYLHLFDPNTFPDVKAFKNEFTGWSGYLNMDRVLKYLEGRFIKQPNNVVKRPSKTWSTVVLDMGPEQRKAYDEIADYLFLRLKSELADDPEQMLNLTSFLTKLIRLRQCAVYPKSIVYHDEDGNELTLQTEESVAIDWTVDRCKYLKSQGENSIVWSSQFVPPLERLYDLLTEQGLSVGRIYGKYTKDARETEKAFQENKLDVLLCNRQSAGKGFNFQKTKDWEGGAKHAIFLDLWYTNTGNEQMANRIWRVNSSEGVMLEVIHIADSVHDFIKLILAQKKAELESLTDDPDQRFKPAVEWLKDLFGDKNGG